MAASIRVNLRRAAGKKKKKQNPRGPRRSFSRSRGKSRRPEISRFLCVARRRFYRPCYRRRRRDDDVSISVHVTRMTRDRNRFGGRRRVVSRDTTALPPPTVRLSRETKFELKKNGEKENNPRETD